MAFTHPTWWRTRPLLGEVKSETAKYVTIQWWEGTYSGTWKRSNKRNGRCGMVPHMEDIPKNNIVKEFSLKIKLGKAIRLPKKIKDELKLVYMQ